MSIRLELGPDGYLYADGRKLPCREPEELLRSVDLSASVEFTARWVEEQVLLDYVKERKYDTGMNLPEPPDAPYLTTARLIRLVRDLYEIREQYRHRAGGPEDPLAELLRRFPEPGA